MIENCENEKTKLQAKLLSYYISGTLIECTRVYLRKTCQQQTHSFL